MHRNPETVSEVVAQVQKLLAAAKPNDVLELIRKFGMNSAELINLYGVALMRAGEVTKALELFRGLCINESGFCLKDGLPVAFKANYATALLLAKNVAGCQATLREITEQGDPYVMKLRAAIEHWRRSLSWWQRLAFDLYGSEPDRPVVLDFPPGQPEGEGPLRPAA